MEFQELQKTRVADLREMMKENLPEVTGVIGLKKEELVDQLGIEKSHKHVAAGLGKRAIKAEIKELKVKRQAALEARNLRQLQKAGGVGYGINLGRQPLSLGYHFI